MEENKLGTGYSGIYYTSHGSKKIHHNAIRHSMEGEYTKDKHGHPQRLKSGGHGQDSMKVMDKYGIKYNIVKTFPNGVRVGNIPDHKRKKEQTGAIHAWFPKSWKQSDIIKAAEFVAARNKGAKDGEAVFANYHGVRVGIIKTHGNIATVFPDYKTQPKPRSKK